MSGILVIEDDPQLRGLIVEILTDHGLAVASADNGSAGLSLASAMAPDLVLCDIKMAGMDGYEVLKALRHDPSTAVTPVIFLTGMGGPENVRAAMNLGADDYLVKPVAPRALVDAVTARLARSATVRAEAARHLTALRAELARSLLPHEFLTPLTAVIGLGSLLTEEDAVPPSDVAEVARGIVEAGQVLESLITKFLHYAELQAPLVEPAGLPEPAKAWEALQVEARDRGSRVGRSADLELQGEPARVTLSLDHWRLLVRELVDNAFKFSEAGKTVRVELAATVDGAALTVRDEGRGMSGEQLAALESRAPFLRRFQDQAGLGLGLSIVRRLLEMYRGDIGFETAPGEGTTVRVRWGRLQDS
jgi:two-component system, sensor histidine kinase and response regulator